MDFQVKLLFNARPNSLKLIHKNSIPKYSKQSNYIGRNLLFLMNTTSFSLHNVGDICLTVIPAA